MKFKSINEFDTFQFKDAVIQSLKITEKQMILEVEGAVIKSNNSNNTRFEDMFCVLLNMQLDQFKLQRFVEQGYKRYDMEGRLTDEVPDRILDDAEQKAVLSSVQGVYLFRLERSQNQDGYELIFDIESDNDEEFTKTYEIDFDFENSVAEWDRFASPVNGQ